MTGGEPRTSFGTMGLHVGTDWSVTCHTYPDRSPILSLDAGEQNFTLSAASSEPDANHIDFAYKLLAAVNDYLIACETRRFDAEETANVSADVAGVEENRAA